MTKLLVELFNAIDFLFCDYVPPHEISVRNVSKIFNILKVLHALSKKKHRCTQIFQAQIMLGLIYDRIDDEKSFVVVVVVISALFS